MKILPLVILSLALGASLGVGIAWARYGGETSASAFRTADAKPNASTSTSTPKVDPSAKVAHVAVAEEAFDFGAVERGAAVSHLFRFTNTGEAVLTLEKGGTTCQKCTIAELSLDKLNPGQSCDVKIDYQAATAGDTKFRQSATILTNDPDRPRVELTVSGSITAIYDIKPNELVFSKLSVHDEKTLEAKLLSYLSDNLEVRGFKLSDPTQAKFLDVTFTPLEEADVTAAGAKSGVKIAVTIKPGMPLGYVRQVVSLETNLEASASIELPVMATIASDISLVGGGWDEGRGYVDLGTKPSSEGRKRTIMLLLRGPHRNDVEVTVGETAPSLLKVTVGEKSTISDGAIVQMPITIEIPPGSPAANHLGSTIGRLGKITLNTTHPEAKQVTLRVRFAVLN